MSDQGETGSSTVTRKVAIEALARNAIVAENGDLLLLEGDIIVDAVEPFDETLEGLGVPSAQRWPLATVPYEIAPGLQQPERVQQAIDHWHQKTGVRFVKRTSETDYVAF